MDRRLFHVPAKVFFAAVGLVLAAGGWVSANAQARAASAGFEPVTDRVADKLAVGKAIILGLVEGITEFLPISSTGHLLVSERLLDLPKTTALDAYTIIIQFGAILAVLVVSWRRVKHMLAGLGGKNAQGRSLLTALVVAFIPAAVIGKVLGDVVEEELLRPLPVAAAWIVGGVVILAVSRRRTMIGASGLSLESITIRHAVITGIAQTAALWPGTSRSFVTILAAVLAGLSLSAAVEFSFLLGLATLSAATLYEVLRHGDIVRDQIGLSAALVGIIVAFASALLAVRWMVSYLQNRDLSVFGYYRIAAGLATIMLVASNVI